MYVECFLQGFDVPVFGRNINLRRSPIIGVDLVTVDAGIDSVEILTSKPNKRVYLFGPME